MRLQTYTLLTKQVYVAPGLWRMSPLSPGCLWTRSSYPWSLCYGWCIL